MKLEYLLFNTVIVIFPLISSIVISIQKTQEAKQKRKALFFFFISCFITAIPFIIWDVYVTDLHWYFNKKYITGLHIFNLPIEEILFFFTIPYATGSLWLILFNSHTHNGVVHSFIQDGYMHRAKVVHTMRWIYPLSIVLLFVAFWLLTYTSNSININNHIENDTIYFGYTKLTVIALCLAILFDYALGSRLLQQIRFYPFIALYATLNFIFNGYLTGRPIVLYKEGQYLGIRLGSTPIEDFFYGLALFIFVLSLLHHFTATKSVESLLKKIIRFRLKNYKIQYNTIDYSLPLYLSESIANKNKKIKVAVIGGGLAGISSAIMLAERGFEVHLFEKNKHLGGKCGAWKKNITGIENSTIDHGFHGFFPCYYNLLDFLRTHNILQKHTKRIDRYTIVNKEQKITHLDNASTTPIYNLFDLHKKKVFNLFRAFFTISNLKLIATLNFDTHKTIKKYDDISFLDFKKQAHLHTDISFILTIFARAFFASEDKLSTAQLLKNFHIYYLSNNEGLLYHYIYPNYIDGFLTPLQELMEQYSITIHNNTPIHTITREHSDNTMYTFNIEDENHTVYKQYNEVIIASDIHATKKIVENSPCFTTALHNHTETNNATNQIQSQTVTQQLQHIPINQRYSVYRIWIKNCTIPFDKYSLFTSFERIHILDTIAQVDFYDDASKVWAKENNGHVLELHCYAVPDSLHDEQSIKEAFLQDLAYYFSQFTPDTLVHEDLQINDNFTPFTVGLDSYKPTTDSGIKGCYFAGDWVSLPVPCSLLEAAHTSARFAANKIVSKYDLQEFSIHSVPLKGLI